MSRFCSSCGFPLAASSAFCPNCGTGAAPPPAPAPAPNTVPSMPPAAVAQGSSTVRIVLIAVGCLVALGIIGAGLTVYAAHRIKQAVVREAKSHGIDLPSSTPASASGQRKTYKPCELLSAREASELLAEPVERAEAKDEMCAYYGPAGLSAKLANEGAADVIKRAGKPGSDVNGGDVADSITKMLGAVAAASGEGGSHGETPLLLLAVDADGGVQMTAVEANKAIFGGIPGVAAEVPNLGDRAVRLGNLGLNVLKGGTILRIIPGPVPAPNDKAVAIARFLLPRI